jgi:hypothetical protein
MKQRSESPCQVYWARRRFLLRLDFNPRAVLMRLEVDIGMPGPIALRVRLTLVCHSPETCDGAHQGPRHHNAGPHLALDGAPSKGVSRIRIGYIKLQAGIIQSVFRLGYGMDD